MARVSDSARIPAELENFRNALVLGDNATGVPWLDSELADVVRRAQRQAELAASRKRNRPDRMDERWENYVRVERWIASRPLGTRSKHPQRNWDLRQGRKQAPGGQGLAGRSPQDTAHATRDYKYQW